MKLYQATKGGVCAGLIIGEVRVARAAPILGGERLEGHLGWWVLKRLKAKGYEIALVERATYQRPRL